MSLSHNHGRSLKNIRIAFVLNLIFAVFEFIGGLYVNSIAILSDALHDFGDSVSLGVSWYLEKKSEQKADNNYTFGYQRFSLLGALINSIILIIGSIFVIQESVERIMHPQASDARGMFYIAIIGVLVNAYAAYRLSKGHTMNERVLSWHLLEDVLGWIAVLVASIVMMFTDIPVLDPALSLGISAFILWGVFRRFRETIRIFLQGSPGGVNIEDIKEKILALDQVESVHKSHAWSLDGEHHVFTSHVVAKNVNGLEDMYALHARIKNILKECGIDENTIEIEIVEKKEDPAQPIE